MECLMYVEWIVNEYVYGFICHQLKKEKKISLSLRTVRALALNVSHVYAAIITWIFNIKIILYTILIYINDHDHGDDDEYETIF